MNKHSKSFTKQAFLSCLMTAFLGALMLPLLMLFVNFFLDKSTNFFQPDYFHNLLMVVWMVLLTSLAFMLLVGFPTLLILNQYKINHLAIAALSGFLIVGICLFSLFDDFFWTEQPMVGLIYGLIGAGYGAFASYFSRK